MTEEPLFRASAAVLQPCAGFRDLFANSDRDKRYHSIMLNAIRDLLNTSFSRESGNASTDAERLPAFAGISAFSTSAKSIPQ